MRTIAMIAMLVELPLAAHHSGAQEFDANKTQAHGRGRQVDWVNPHAYISLR